MDLKIIELKELGVAYEAALEFDNCPGPKQAEYLIEHIMEADLELLKTILDKYEGWSPSDLSGKVFTIIDKL